MLSTRRHALIRFTAALLCATGLLVACSNGGANWSEREKRNAGHLVDSLAAANRAAGLINRFDGSNPALREPILQELRQALVQASQVDDGVLDKLSPRLYAQFRIKYQQGLGKMIKAFENGDPNGVIDASAEVQDFMKWYQGERHAFRWWEGATGGN